MAHQHGQHHHSHSHHGDHSHTNTTNRKVLFLSFLLIAGFMIVEFIGGFLTGSLALVSDAGHMFSDAVSLFLSFIAIWIANRPPSASKTFGYKRMEILVAFFNGVTLIAISLYIIIEAYHRFFIPVKVSSPGMLMISVLGFLINLLVAYLLTRGNHEENLNLRSALFHVLSDLLGSVGAIVAALLILLFQWNVADSIASILVSFIILYSGWKIIGESINILMEGAPQDMDVQEMKASMMEIKGVADVHDLHVWTVTSGFPALSCHVLMEQNASSQDLLSQLNQMIRNKYRIVHTTIQIEEHPCLTEERCH